MNKTGEKKSIVKFAPRGADSFYNVMKEKVDNYFEENNIAATGNRAMHIKTFAMLSLYFIPYFIMMTGLTANAGGWLFYTCWLLMGMGMAGIGASVMHDSNHGSYSKYKFVNVALGNVLNVLGGYSRNWRIQHNVLHHTYTNIDGLDEDIAGTSLIRMSPNVPLWRIHRYQHIYAWFLYALMNLFWITVKDYRQIFRYQREDLLKKEKVTLKKAFTELTMLKLFFIGYMIVLPMAFSGMAWYHIIFGLVAMQMLAGLVLACIFQPAHVMETSEYAIPNAERKLQDNWALHQLKNTTNFAPKSKISSWFIGGLNFQIEHHLFPHICHIHYPQLSKIVKKVAEDHGIIYNVQPTVLHALIMHGRMLKQLGART